MRSFTLRIKRLTAGLTLCVLIFAGCGGNTNTTTTESAVEDAAADTVERYLTAKANGDEAGIRANLCAAMEADIQREVTSFSAVTGVTIENMDCTRDGDTVTCTGAIITEYGAENTTFPLRTYRVVQEDGEWKWCGEASALGGEASTSGG